MAFVRKRDKRVLANKRLLEERAALNRQKQEQNRLEQIRRRQEELEEVRLSRDAQKDDDYEEQLKQLEQQYSDEEYDEEDVETDDADGLELSSLNGDMLIGEDDTEDYLDDLYCVACNRGFKNENAFANHETSKKHRENLGKLKAEMQNEEDAHQNSGRRKEQEEVEQTDEDLKPPNRSRKGKKDAKKSKTSVITLEGQDDENKFGKEELEKSLEKDENGTDTDEGWANANKKGGRKNKNKQKASKGQTIKQTAISSCVSPAVTKNEAKETNHSNGLTNLTNHESHEKTLHICATCQANFESKNKLFVHLKLTNHSVYLPRAKVCKEEMDKGKKPKGKRR